MQVVGRAQVADRVKDTPRLRPSTPVCLRRLDGSFGNWILDSQRTHMSSGAP